MGESGDRHHSVEEKRGRWKSRVVVLGNEVHVAAGAVPFDHGFARKRRSSSAWNGALASQVYV